MSSPSLHGYAPLNPSLDQGGLLFTKNSQMEKNIKDDARKVYEIGYLLVSSVPPEKVAQLAASLKEVLSNKDAEIISEEAPELTNLAYTMIKKIGTVNHRFDEGYFGWVKFEVSGKEIEEIKKAFEMHPDMLRVLLITTVRDNTYLGKKAVAAPVLVNSMNPEGVPGEVGGTDLSPVATSDIKEIPTSVEEMDKSIDEMVKGA